MSDVFPLPDGPHTATLDPGEMLRLMLTRAGGPSGLQGAVHQYISMVGQGRKEGSKETYE